jgi:hypothetical protein
LEDLVRPVGKHLWKKPRKNKRPFYVPMQAAVIKKRLPTSTLQGGHIGEHDFTRESKKVK